jgi:amino acid transporter
MEYEALRAEIIERISLRNQIMLATLTLAGIMLSFGVANPSIAFVLPIIATFLATAWIQHDVRTGEIAGYIYEHIESKLPGMGWEAHRHQRPRKGTRLAGMRLTVLSAGGVFFVIQAVALFIGFSKYDTLTAIEWILGGIAIAFTILTLILLGTSRRASQPGTTRP